MIPTNRLVTFDVVIWVTIARFWILKLQGAIASKINLELDEIDVDKLKMKLSAYLRANNIFLVLDDMWTSLDLKTIGDVLTTTERAWDLFSKIIKWPSEPEDSMKMIEFSSHFMLNN